MLKDPLFAHSFKHELDSRTSKNTTCGLSTATHRTAKRTNILKHIKITLMKAQEAILFFLLGGKLVSYYLYSISWSRQVYLVYTYCAG